MDDYEEGDEVSLPRDYNPNRCRSCKDPLVTAVVMAVGKYQFCGHCATREKLHVHVEDSRPRANTRPHRNTRRSIRLYVYNGGRAT